MVCQMPADGKASGGELQVLSAVMCPPAFDRPLPRLQQEEQEEQEQQEQEQEEQEQQHASL